MSQVHCPDCGLPNIGGQTRIHWPGCPRKNQTTTNQTQAERSEAPNPETAVPPVDPEVLDRAGKVIEETLIDRGWNPNDFQPPDEDAAGYNNGGMDLRFDLDTALKSAAPVIAAAAYRQGRDDLEARIEAKAAEIDRAADKYQEDGLRFTESGDHAASMGAFNYETRSRDVAKLLRSLLTDKEEA